jgi:hypothetical protein
VQFADFLSRLTVRRVLEFIAIAILVMAFVQTVPIEIAFLFAGDTLTYLEFAVIVRLAAGKEHFWHALHLAARLARFAMRVFRAAIHYPVLRINRWRERRSAAQAARPRRISDDSDDGRSFAFIGDTLVTA